MTPLMDELTRRLEEVSRMAARDLETEAWAGEWTGYAISSQIAASVFWDRLTEPTRTHLLGIAARGPQPETFPDDQQDKAVSFYFGASRACLAALANTTPGSREFIAWQLSAHQCVAEAEAASLRLKRHTASQRHRVGADHTNARYDQARAMATQIGQERWDSWCENREGSCPRINEVVKEIHRFIAADPQALCLDAVPTGDTIRKWLNEDCTIPPEARQPGRRKRTV